MKIALIEPRPPFNTYLPEEALLHADQVVTGEGETVVREVFEGRQREPEAVSNELHSYGDTHE